MKHAHKLMTATFAAIIAGGVHAGDDKMEFSAWDADGNGKVSLAEWDQSIEEHGVFDRLDQNNSGTFDIDEAVDSPIEYDVSMDLDDGGHIERQEFTAALFDHYDNDSDDNLSESELMEFGKTAEESQLLSSN